MLRSFLLISLLLSTPVYAQQDVTIPITPHAADTLSTIGAFGSIGLSSWQAYRSPNRKQAFLCEGLRVGLSSVAAEVTKRLIHEDRPDGSDNRSFFSEHTSTTASAVSSLGWNIGLTIGVGFGRMAANKHYPWDVAAGAGVGELTHFIPGCR
jgi:membrane-associated phospholipid phosphatase